MQIKNEVKNMSNEIEREKSFLELWEMGMKFFKTGDPHWRLRWCVKQQQQVSFERLKKLECWKCPQFVCNKGICDPI